ncbi:hypothetical protein BDZ89DRAFT_945714 [Hymenopellis radicata]|nr:hypothetical protein BDZ89DRAFT_945714 [Hymenopellis radicata]
MSLRARSTKSSYFESPDVSDAEDAPKRKTKSTPKRKRNDDTEASDTDVAPKPKAKKPRQSSKKSSPRKKKQKVDSDEEQYNSDDLDDDLPKPKRGPKKKTKATDDEDDDEGVDLKAGQKVVGVVIEAPKSGQVPAGQISKNTLDFLQKLQDPKCNDREWYVCPNCDRVYRQAEKEWKDFVDAFTDVMTGVDPEVPPLPPKDLIHRIYRDVRFSNDKTPYKTSFSASFSRSGRKGIFACFKSGGGSLLAAGSWCPGKNELDTIRHNIQRDPQRLRDAISSPDFVRYFGEPKPSSDGSRQNIFGSEDELKVAPKGIDKNHRADIDLLKCRSFAVFHRHAFLRLLTP